MHGSNLLLQLLQQKCIQILKNVWIPPATFIFNLHLYLIVLLKEDFNTIG